MPALKKCLALLLCLALLAGCAAPAATPSSSSSVPQQRTITDMAGRTVTLPQTLEKVYCTNPVSAIMLYTFAPEKLLGWNYALNQAEREYILPEYRDLPVFGMGDMFNPEAVVAAGPQLCFVAGGLTPADVENAQRFEQQLGIPVVMLDGALSQTAQVYTLLGEIFEMPQRAEALAGYATTLLTQVANTQIPPEERVAVYYGNGIDSLDTAAKGSTASEVLDMLGAENVAVVESQTGQRIQVTLEQLLAWNPQVIFLNGEPKQSLTGKGAAADMLANTSLASLAAVQSGRVYGVPKEPFAWLDRPVAPNRLIGLKWAGSLLYPQYYSYDMAAETREFYKLFYHIELTQAQLDALLTLQ